MPDEKTLAACANWSGEREQVRELDELLLGVLARRHTDERNELVGRREAARDERDERLEVDRLVAALRVFAGAAREAALRDVEDLRRDLREALAAKRRAETFAPDARAERDDLVVRP